MPILTLILVERKWNTSLRFFLVYHVKLNSDSILRTLKLYNSKNFEETLEGVSFQMEGVSGQKSQVHQFNMLHVGVRSGVFNCSGSQPFFLAPFELIAEDKKRTV